METARARKATGTKLSGRTHHLDLGRTHFGISPGIMSAPATGVRSYDQEWANWMGKASSSKEPSYDEQWAEWMRKHSPEAGRAAEGSASDAEVATAPEIEAPTQPTAFESAPFHATFDALVPIMSRLPRQPEEAEDSKDCPDYLQAGPSEQNVQYTRARLPSLDADSIELWRALHHLRPITTDYAAGYLATARPSQRARAPHPIASDADIASCPAFAPSKSEVAAAALSTIRRVFNWDALPALPLDVEGEWYGVAFRSARKKGSESLNLYEADRLSHLEAVQSGGLMMYWYGAPDPKTGENLATCIWTNRHDAIVASALPLHALAAKHARPAYAVFDLTRYAVRKMAGEPGLRIEEWTEEV